MKTLIGIVGTLGALAAAAIIYVYTGAFVFGPARRLPALGIQYNYEEFRCDQGGQRTQCTLLHGSNGRGRL